jgi:hypothetical protein
VYGRRDDGGDDVASVADDGRELTSRAGVDDLVNLGARDEQPAPRAVVPDADRPTRPSRPSGLGRDDERRPWGESKDGAVALLSTRPQALRPTRARICSGVQYNLFPIFVGCGRMCSRRQLERVARQTPKSLITSSDRRNRSLGMINSQLEVSGPGLGTMGVSALTRRSSADSPRQARLDAVDRLFL